MEWILLFLFVLYATALCIAAIKVNDMAAGCEPGDQCDMCPDENCKNRMEAEE